MSKTTIPDEDRFWRYVNVSNDDKCWEWIAGKTSRGYGKFWLVKKQKAIPAHVFSYILAHGDIPNNLWVLHKCDNRPCVNPNHLFLGNNQDNMIDAKNKGRLHFKFGELQINHKLENKDILKIRSLWKNKICTQAKLAKEYNVCVSTIHRIIHRQIWKHI